MKRYRILTRAQLRAIRRKQHQADVPTADLYRQNPVWRGILAILDEETEASPTDDQPTLAGGK